MCGFLNFHTISKQQDVVQKLQLVNTVNNVPNLKKVNRYKGKSPFLKVKCNKRTSAFLFMYPTIL